MIHATKRTLAIHLTTVLLLSWVFAACEQIMLPIPFSPVPVNLAPLHLYIATHLFGWVAVHAFALYLLQGALGAPFFAWGLGGFVRLSGPTGGYLIGMLFAMVFLMATRKHLPRLLALCSASAIVFVCGLTQLSFFVPAGTVLAAGLYPFVLGDVVKIGVAWIATRRRRA